VGLFHLYLKGAKEASLTDTPKEQPQLIQSNTDFIMDAGSLVRKHTQTISQAFLDDLQVARNESTSKPAGEFHRIASIPTVIAERWLREGFDLWEATGEQIVRKLHSEDMSAFMATGKRT
jgi:hypothetical protein|tara:strand:+ start:405 stop:764 length:360 start_codon:yes stop_codon:yes gene_type:complete